MWTSCSNKFSGRLVQVFCQPIDGFEAAKKFLSNDPEQGVPRDGQNHTGDTCKAASNADNQEDLQWVSVNAIGKNDRLCEKIVDKLGQQEYGEAPADQGGNGGWGSRVGCCD